MREFASVNFCIVHGSDVPTTIPSCSSVIPDVLNIVVVKDFVLPVNLTVCSELSSDHFPVTVDIRGRSSFQVLPDRTCLKRGDWTHFQDHLSDRFNGNPRVDSVEDINAMLDELSNAIHETMYSSARKSQHSKQPFFTIPPTILANISE